MAVIVYLDTSALVKFHVEEGVLLRRGRLWGRRMR
jgi:hypothetical protein